MQLGVDAFAGFGLEIFLVTSVRGIGLLPMTAPSSALTFMGFMNAAFGLRLAAAFFFAGAFFAAFFFAAIVILRLKVSYGL